MQKFRPGENCSQTGNYTAYSENDEIIGNVYLEEGQTFPPTQYEGGYYSLD